MGPGEDDMAEAATLTTATTIAVEGVDLDGDLTLPPRARGSCC
jgi:hypothetical protein